MKHAVNLSSKNWGTTMDNPDDADWHEVEDDFHRSAEQMRHKRELPKWLVEWKPDFPFGTDRMIEVEKMLLSLDGGFYFDAPIVNEDYPTVGALYEAAKYHLVEMRHALKDAVRIIRRAHEDGSMGCEHEFLDRYEGFGHE